MPEPQAVPDEPVVSATEDAVAPSWPRRLLARLRGAQFVRYLCVGVFNTIFGYATFVTILTLLNHALPPRFLYLTVILASVLSNPLNITVAYFGYKFFVFKTRGNYLREWLKCFAVYGTSMIPGLVALSALTRILQGLFHRHSAHLHASLASVQSHLAPQPQTLLQHLSHGPAVAGYIAGAIVIAFSTIFSFIGHKKVTFKQAST